LIRKLQPKFQEIWGIFGIFGNFCAKKGIFSLCAAPRGARLQWEAPNAKKFIVLDFPWKITTVGAWPRILG